MIFIECPYRTRYSKLERLTFGEDLYQNAPKLDVRLKDKIRYKTHT